MSEGASKRLPYPLQWPAGWKRTDNWRRHKPRFVSRFAQDRDSVLRQLKLRRGSHIVITSDLPVRNDGLPYANSNCSDPGIAVYWVEKGHEHVIACDRWRTVSDNLRAIEMSLDALRALDRWGASETVEKAFAGFAALPPGDGTHTPPASPSKRPWRSVFSIEGVFAQLGHADLLAVVRSRYRMRMQTAHPDAGGSHELAAELNGALEEAELELGK